MPALLCLRLLTITALGLTAEPDGTFTLLYTAQVQNQRFWAIGRAQVALQWQAASRYLPLITNDAKP